ALFDRSRRKAELTPIGRLVLEQGRHILKASEALTDMVRQAAEDWEVELRICIESILRCEPVYELIKTFQEIQPKTEIHLSKEGVSGSWDGLVDDRWYLVVGGAGTPPTWVFRFQPLGQEGFDFAEAANHPVTQL